MSHEFDLDKIIDPELSIAEDCCSVASSYQTVRYGNIYDNLAEHLWLQRPYPWKKLSEKAKKVFLYGTEKKWTRMHFVHPVTGAPGPTMSSGAACSMRRTAALRKPKANLPQKNAEADAASRSAPTARESA